MSNTPYIGIKNPIPSPMLGGQYSVDDFWNGYNAMVQNRVIAKKNQQIKNREEFKKNYNPKDLFPKEFYEPTRDLIITEIEDLVNKQAEAEAAGVDFSRATDLQKQFREKQLKVLELGQMGKEMQEMIDAAGKQVQANPDDFSYNDYLGVINEAKAIPDPYKKKEFLQEKFSEYFTPVFNPYDFAADIVPKPDQEGRITYVDPDKFKNGIQYKLANASPVQIEAALKQARKTNPDASTLQDVADYVFKSNEDEIWRKVAPAKVTKTNDSESRNFGLGGSKAFTIDMESKYTTSEGRADTANVTGLKPTIYDNGKGGTVMLGTSLQPYVGTDGKWYFRGYSSKIKGQIPYDATKDEYEQKAMAAQKFGVDMDNVLIQDGNVVAYGQGAMEDVPAERNKSAFSAASGGVLFEDAVDRWNSRQNLQENKATAEKYASEKKAADEAVIKENQDYLSRLKKLDPKTEITDAGEKKTVAEAINRVEGILKSQGVGSSSEKKQSGKNIKRSEISAKAKAAGYTDAEYEKALKERGVTIVD